MKLTYVPVSRLSWNYEIFERQDRELVRNFNGCGVGYLHLDKGIYEATPEVRNSEYYKKRPCREMVEDAALIFAQYVEEQEAKEQA